MNHLAPVSPTHQVFQLTTTTSSVIQFTMFLFELRNNTSTFVLTINTNDGWHQQPVVAHIHYVFPRAVCFLRI